MKALIIEDDLQKANAVAEFLTQESQAFARADISFTENLSDAVRVISVSSFDLIVLDLMLPYLTDGLADSRAGIELLRQIRKSDSPNKGATIAGLSAFPDELESSRNEFEKYGVLITSYDAGGKWKKALGGITDHVKQHTRHEMRFDFLIFVALEEEYLGFKTTKLKTTTRSTIGGLNVEFCTLEFDKTLQGAIVRLRHMGLVAAVLDVTTALSVFSTPIVCMSGICAGFSERSELGQLIVASPAWEYQAGKWSSNGFEIAPTQFQLRPRTRVVINQALENDALLDKLEKGLDRTQRRPSRRSKPMLAPAATGSAVIADASRLSHVEQQHRKVAALDMETFGVYYAAHEATRGAEHFFSVKCVVDLADSDKADDLHGYGCAVAARATVHILKALLEA